MSQDLDAGGVPATSYQELVFSKESHILCESQALVVRPLWAFLMDYY